jgi:tripartite-type tricarboxylate transporter receptor subunit TctC
MRLLKTSSTADILVVTDPMAILDPVTAPPPVRAGKIKAYAVTAMTHLPAAPDVPTVDEAGLPGLHMAPWHGIWAPKSTAKAITSRLNAAVKPERAPAHRRSRNGNSSTRAADTRCLRAFQKAEIEKWRPIIEAANAAAWWGFH